MKTTHVIGFVLVVALVGCGGDKAAHAPSPDGEYEHGDSGEYAESPEFYRLSSNRPASKLQDIQASDAGQTPLNLGLFFLQQEKGQKGYGDDVARLVVALVEAGDKESAAEVALLAPEEQGPMGLIYLVKHAAESGDVALATSLEKKTRPKGVVLFSSGFRDPLPGSVRLKPFRRQPARARFRRGATPSPAPPPAPQPPRR